MKSNHATMVNTVPIGYNILSVIFLFKNNHRTLLNIFPLQGKSINHKYVFVNKYLAMTTKVWIPKNPHYIHHWLYHR